LSVIHAEALRAVIVAAEEGYPEECCGLLIGRRSAGDAVEITATVAAANVAPGDRRRRFEIDPALRLRTMRGLVGGCNAIVGHYHSHPDRPTTPSPTDVAMAYEPDLLWLITAVVGGKATETAAFVIRSGRIRRLGLALAAAHAPHSAGLGAGGEDEGCSEA
jgi:proteasome lid subunit RPN8/RPN11